ncbi:ferric iron reductase, partial [Streptomyces sp. URMC 123]|uniref:ferric iron reductase n=1 Tax=Streptomyces sp. URMC 123 TaxID=3423403 RepID=UPI003F1A22EF
ILVLENGVPRRVIMKDIAEEIVVMDPDTELPPEAERVRSPMGPRIRTLALRTDVFDGFLRFLNATLATAGLLDEAAFWRTVAECV